ncbi:MAG: cob(I)yrinic acid a,c-diamide adenosyltransferase [Planctomycetaceae bacterium]|nr:cob(I)yrinic acid a,c-diamide adenosyltransferase [Planctomycetaceae bacterium]
MVYLNRIYTRSGDQGNTSLGTGERVPKTHPRIAAYGGVDELNAVLGMVLTSGLPDPMARMIRHIQNDLFDVGADLCIPQSVGEGEPTESTALRIIPDQVARLEKWIDDCTERLSPLESFILPGGTPQASHLHLARTVCRRVELAVCALAEVSPVNEQAVIYLNRLSDLLFVLARAANDWGRGDVLWVPGKNRQPDDNT